MRRIFSVFFVLIAAALLAVSPIGRTAGAADYTNFGQGTLSCGTWTEEKEKDSSGRQFFHTWITGYMTAYSRWVEDGSGPVSEADNSGAWAWIDNYCQENPLKKVANAAEQLIYEIEANE